MSAINKIKAPIKNEMEEFQIFFNKIMKSKVYLLEIITKYIIKTKGKQMRPMFVFLSAKLNGDIQHSTYVAAALIELLHTATLVHDDVVDNSDKRRGVFSIKALWESKIAVLVGDYFLSKGLLLAVDNNEFDLLRILSEAVKEMAEGELVQLEKSRSLNITEDIYFDIIRKKTATLIASSTASGAKSVGASAEQVDKMSNFGVFIGIAFQIKDDLFDYQTNNLIGKPVGNDIQEKKMTLPLIFALQKASKIEKRKILRLVKKKNKSHKDINFVISYVKKSGGVEYAENKMNEYKNNAIDILNYYEESTTKQALLELVNYTISRKK